MKALSVLLACFLAAHVAFADDAKTPALVQGSVGGALGGGYTAPDGTANAGVMARGSFRYLKDSGHLILSIDSAAALGVGVSGQSWSDGPPPVIGMADVRAAIGGKTNGGDGCGYFALGGGEGQYNGLGVYQGRVNAFVESGLACTNLFGKQLSLFVGPIAKLQADFLQQESAQVLAGGRAELIGRRGSIILEGVGSVANLSGGAYDAKSQVGASASGEIKVWRNLALGATVAYDYYGYKAGPYTYSMDGVTGLTYLAWHFDRKPAASTTPAK